jgi:hypothetical protein
MVVVRLVCTLGMERSSHVRGSEPPTGTRSTPNTLSTSSLKAPTNHIPPPRYSRQRPTLSGTQASTPFTLHSVSFFTVQQRAHTTRSYRIIGTCMYIVSRPLARGWHQYLYTTIYLCVFPLFFRVYPPVAFSSLLRPHRGTAAASLGLSHLHHIIPPQQTRSGFMLRRRPTSTLPDHTSRP